MEKHKGEIIAGEAVEILKGMNVSACLSRGKYGMSHVAYPLAEEGVVLEILNAVAKKHGACERQSAYARQS